ncbi:hypothetical protein BW721_06670 [Jeotgalibaca sp. PTS2502]|uniref:SMP-30/gluconolactonase/LRE family protein n=1 Tax=Jeotgalibaca sp. PTS2502 TaxID=1903686 RepID=UPI0009737793|nr:SMP-30/gluconolactonase/LRE family protein [Jeotgalibaca sp. PTS2502]APZ49387.1 hypothetical protein BW721_06670 [Jeotgalibaca sp. PTS2502]
MYQTFEPELVYFAQNSLLEGPVWDSQNQLLYFLSITDHVIYVMNEQTKEIRTYLTSGPVGAAVLYGEHELLSAEKEGIFKINKESGERSFLCQPNQDERLRYNDGKLDPKGRFLIGNMGYHQTVENGASLYVVDGDGQYQTLLKELTLSNGLGWSQDGQTMYHIDTPTRAVHAYDYDLEIPALSNKRLVCRITGDGVPDGMCVDRDGRIWVAEYGGKQVCLWNTETGKKEGHITLPVSNITSCCLGGEHLNDLYITTAKKDGEPLSGGLFKVKLR